VNTKEKHLANGFVRIAWSCQSQVYILKWAVTDKYGQPYSLVLPLVQILLLFIVEKSSKNTLKK
jgi:hypothetical protein